MVDFLVFQPQNIGIYNMLSVNDLINKYSNIKYRRNGRNPESGLDCWGVVLNIVKDIYNIELPDTNYELRSLLKTKHDIFGDFNIENWLQKVEELKYGDIILFYSLYNLPIHAGIYLGRQRFIHSAMPYGTRIEDLQVHKQKIAGYYRVKN